MPQPTPVGPHLDVAGRSNCCRVSVLVLSFGGSTEKHLCPGVQGTCAFSPTPSACLLAMCTGIVAGFSDCGGVLVAAELSLLCAPKAWRGLLFIQRTFMRPLPTEAGTVVAAPLDLTAS